MSAKKYVMAYDLGTTGNKATLFDEEGNLTASTFSEYQVFYPSSNWAEQDPKDWWKAVCNTTHELLQISGVQPLDIACLVFSGQMMGCVPVDKQGEPLGRAIIWADQRGVKQVEQLTAELGHEYIYHTVGHRPSPSYTAAKIMWIRDNEPQRYKETYKFLQAKDFIVARMTGRYVTDFTDASGTNLFNLKTLSWSEELIQTAGLNRNQLPDTVLSTEVVGGLRKTVSDQLGLLEGLPVVIGGGDGSCATAGAGATKPGIAYNYLGSSSWIGLATDKPILDPKMRTFTFVHVVPGLYSPIGTMQAAGLSYQWMRDNLFSQIEDEARERGVSPYQMMDLEATEAPPGSDNLLYLPYLMGERSPHWNPLARGAFIGLKITHSRSHMIRAVMEGVTYNLKMILDSFIEQGEEVNDFRLIGGGAKGEIWRQIIADIYGKELMIPSYLDEATSMGAALTGGVGIGLYQDFSVIDNMLKVNSRVNMNPTNREIYENLYSSFQNAYDALLPIYEELSS